MQTLKIIGVMLFLLVNSRVHADDVTFGSQGPIVPDGSLLTTVCEADTVFKITGGEKRGANLFHSFSRFSVESGKTALFSNDSNVSTDNTDNIISRVTGNIRSEINGIIRANLQSGFENVNFFLLNPAGITLGSGATLEIDGSVHLSTADYIRLQDGNIFYVDSELESTLTTADVAAFGFLKSTENVAIPSSISIDDSTLKVRDGQTLSLVAGDIMMKGANLSAPGGHINIGSNAYGMEVVLDNSIPNSMYKADEPGNFGEVFIAAGPDIIDPFTGESITNPTNINTSSNSGLISIRGGKITLDQSNVSAGSAGVRDAGTIIFDVRSLSMENGASIDVGASGKGIAGRIDITATTNVNLTGNKTKITAIHTGSSKAGNITIETPTLGISKNAEITTSTASSNQEGSAGNINLKINSLALEDDGRIAAATSNIGSGGIIIIKGYNGKEAADKVIVNQGEISTTTSFEGAGGNIEIKANQVTVENQGTITTESRSNFENAGNAGNFKLRTDKLLVQSGGVISSETSNDGNAGNIEIIAKDQVIISNSGSISSKSEGLGNAGKIDFKISELRLDNANITTEAEKSDGGGISITGNSPAKLVSLKNDSAITATVGGGPETTGGNITIDSDLVTLQNSRIIAEAFEGTGGNINIKAKGLFVDPNSRISASSQFGVDGTVEIDSVVEVIDGVVGLPETYMPTIQLRQETCAQRLGGGKTSSFTIREKSGMPISPEDMLSGDYSNLQNTAKQVFITPEIIKSHISFNEQYDIDCRNRTSSLADKLSW